MTTETKLTPEQRAALDKLGVKFLLGSLWNGLSHAIMLILMNFIAVAFVQVAKLPQGLAMILSVLAALFVFNRVFAITKESHVKLMAEVKKITEPEAE